MTDRRDAHGSMVGLTDDPTQHPAVFAAAFNRGDATALDRVYEDAGVLVAEPGRPVTGTAREAANARFLDLGLPIDVQPRHVYVAGDVALLIVDWSIRGRGRDGNRLDLAGTATDVARRAPDGYWRYLIDNPFGVG